MNFHRGTWFAIGVAATLFALLNLHCWRPGIGGRTDRVNGVRPVGSELELYYGWPSCYRAELLRSDDPELSSRVLWTAPFQMLSSAEGWVCSRHVSATAIVLDTCFALLALVLVAVLFECQQRERWPRRALVAALILAFLLWAEYWVAERFSVHL